MQTGRLSELPTGIELCAESPDMCRSRGRGECWKHNEAVAMKCVPKIDAAYWTSLSLASVFGANAGDFIADVVRIARPSDDAGNFPPALPPRICARRNPDCVAGQRRLE